MTATPKASLRHLTPDRRSSRIMSEPQNAAFSSLQRQTLMDHAELCDGLIENSVGTVPVPLGVATNFVINGRERLVAMATEERSVVAAASKGAKLCRPAGFSVEVSRPLTFAQILYSGLESPKKTAADVEADAANILDELRRHDPLVKHGGGLVAIWTKITPSERGPLLIVELSMVACEAMGANIATRFAEMAATRLEPITGRRRTAAICDNRRSGWRVRAEAVWSGPGIDGGVIGGILDLQAWAEADVCRAVTHNKGVMNGVTAVALAAGQDTRAIEAANHAAAAGDGKYRPLTGYRREGTGGVRGEINLLLPIGVVGGATSLPLAAQCRRLMDADSAAELAEVIGAVGLAQNFAALRALADEGLPAGHRRLESDRR